MRYRTEAQKRVIYVGGMRDDKADPQAEALFRCYRVALVAFNAASATLTLHFVARTLPSAQEIAAEESARAAVVAARRNLWAVYAEAAATAPPAASLAETNRANAARWEDLEIAPIG